MTERPSGFIPEVPRLERQVYLVLLDRIYPGPREAVERAWGTPELQFARFYNQDGNRGMYSLLREPGGGFAVAYLSFEEDAPDAVLDQLRGELSPFYPDNPQQELCFNLYGRNLRAIAFVQSLGFRLGMHGYKYQSNTRSTLASTRLTLPSRPYWDDDLDQYADLLDSAYDWLQQAGGKPVNRWAQDPAELGRMLESADQAGMLCNGWVGPRLAGMCLMRSNGYIENLAVHPDFQNRGYGRAILFCAVNTLRERGLQRIHLDVSALNERARHFYERCGFSEFGFFADHTYSGIKLFSPQ